MQENICDIQKDYWLIDTNILMDLIIGSICYNISIMLPKGKKYCKSILINKKDIIQISTNKNKINRVITENIIKLFELLIDNGISLMVTSITKNELYNVLNKIRKMKNNIENKYQNQLKHKYLNILPLEGIIDYISLIDNLFLKEAIKVINIKDDLKRKINKIIKELEEKHNIGFDKEDWHLMAVLEICNNITSIYTDEESLFRGLDIYLKEYLNINNVNIGTFGDFLSNLRLLNIVDKDFYIISYYAYKFQRLLYSHRMVFNTALGLSYTPSMENLLTPSALRWIVYSQYRLNYYVPLDKIIRVMKKF